jgi:hypothetical protein
MPRVIPLLLAVALGQAPYGIDRYTPEGLERLPLLLDGARIRQVGSWDETGGNDDGFLAGHTIRRTPDGESVLVEEEGPGCLYRFNFSNLFARDGGRGNVISIFLDGSPTPAIRTTLEDFFSGRWQNLRAPWAGHAQLLWGIPIGHYLYFPIPFQRGCLVTLKREPLFYNITYHLYAPGTAVRTWRAADRAPPLPPPGPDPKPTSGNQTARRDVLIAPDASAELLRLAGPATVQSLRLRIRSSDEALALRTARLRCSFDGAPTVDAPLDLFFAIGFDGASSASLLVGGAPRQEYYAHFPMPFARDATLSLFNAGPAPFDAAVDLAWRPGPPPPGRAGTFEARVHEEHPTLPGRDFRVLHTGGAGHVVGVFLAMEMDGLDAESFLEGDERFTLDGDRSPAVHGNATETFFNGSWYFAGARFPHVLFGPQHESRTGLTLRRTALRLTIGDAVPFRASARMGFEVGAFGHLPARYRSIVWLYRTAGSLLKTTDALDVGDAASEAAHAWQSGGTPFDTTGAFPGDDDDVAVAERGRELPAGGVSRFRVSLDPRNAGIRLVRAIDFERAAPTGQRARVTVDGLGAGDWFTPGRYEGRPPAPPWLRNAPDKRLREVDFEVPALLTAGRSSVEIVVTNTGAGPWNELAYRVACLLPSPEADASPPGPVGPLRVEGTRVVGAPAADDFGVAEYELHRGPDLVGRAAAPRVEDPAAPPGASATWTMTAVDHAGNRGPASPPVTAVAPRTVVHEAERLAVRARSPGTDAVVLDLFPFLLARLDRAWGGDAALVFRARAPGDSLTLALPVARSGRHRLRLQLTAWDEGVPWPNTGAFRALIDEAPLGGVLFPPRGGLTTIVELGESVLAPGERLFRLEVQPGTRVLGLFLDRVELTFLD